MPKTRKKVEEWLMNFAADKGYAGCITRAADVVLANALNYDYMGEDRVFLAHCEDIVKEAEMWL